MLRILIKCLLGFGAVLSQAMAVLVLWQPMGMVDPLLGFFIWQVLAAFMAAWFVLTALPSHYNRLGGLAFAHAFAICLFLPVAGLALFLVLLLVSAVFPAPRRHADFAVVENPEFVTYLISRVNHGMGARLRARLENPNVSTDDRLSAMAAFRYLPPHITGGILVDLLSDETEEIRLLAYGIFDMAEKAIVQEILLAREKMAGAVTSMESAYISSRLAELHWELIYQNFVRGEVRRYTLERVEQYAHEALELNSRDANMWYLLGRCALFGNNPEDAETFFSRARRNQFPSGRLLPWLGEAAFLRRDYRKIRELLAPLNDSGTTSSMLQPVVRYWVE